ncbi:MAG TPA: carboxypeptidase-like regulatory domain-containing protein [Flavobacterium sp.]|jgi:hypothetical protein
MKCLRFLVSAAVILLLSGCNPEDDNNNNNGSSGSDFIENFGSEVQRDFIGQIVDTNNQPIQNATVKVGSSTAQTDSNGIFIIKDAQVYEQFAYIKATKAGFIDGSRSMVPTAGKNKVKIMLLSSAPTATVSSGSASEVSIYSGTKVIFDGAFEDENGNEYTGDVNVSMFYLNPSNENIGSLMPGMLYAETGAGEEAALQTFGMLHVELRGTGGQKLQIADGHTAEITMRIDDDQLATAPSTIPLWHFDEAAGYWKEDGIATKEGNFYVGEVSHFSWWNCDAPFPTVSLQVTVVDSDGNPVANALVTLEFAGSNYATSGYSNTDGSISGLIPANQTLTMTVFDDCGGIVSTSTIGPFATDTVLPATMLASAVETVQIEGTLLQCDYTNVANGYVALNYSGQYSYAPVTNGSFSFSTLVCDTADTFTLQGFDYDNLQQTDSVAYTYTVPLTNVGNLVVCTAIDEFITYQIDTDPAVILLQEINGGIEGNMYFQAYGFNGNQSGLSIYGQITTPGFYTTANLSIEGNGIYISSAIPNDVVFTVTSLGNVGDYIDITFNGTYTDDGVHTINGTAHVIRTY